MQVKVLYFAKLRELRGCSSEILEIEPATTVGALYEQIFGAGAPTVACTRNRAICPPHTPLADGDEVSFLPPLGGG